MECKCNKEGKRVVPDTRKNRLMAYFKEYCHYTGIHGFKYIGEERTLFERIWWISSILLSVFLCGLMIYTIFQKYIHYPVLVTFSMQETRLQKIPFPAVTICPRAKISQSYLNLTYYFSRKYRNGSINAEEEKQVNIASTICDYYASAENNEGTTDEDFYKFLEESRTDFFEICYYLGREINCSDVFTPILTEEGICHSYNILDKREVFRDDVEFRFRSFHNTKPSRYWNIEQGYTANILHTYPKRALRTGAKNALYLVLKTKVSDIEYQCPTDESGYRISLHTPFNMPDVTENHFTLGLNQRVTAAVFPHVMKTSDGVKMFDVMKRDCYFQSEKYLRFFKMYSQSNCMIECKTNYTLNVCGCVGFYMPKVAGTPICLLGGIECMEEAEYNFSMYNEYSEIYDDGNSNNISHCGCRPTCNDITYSMELSQNVVKYLPILPEEKQEFNKYHYSILNIFFMKNHIETKERNELYGFSDVVSNFGGLLGLFTGFSIISFMEIIYFISLRIWGNIRLYGNWNGPATNN